MSGSKGDREREREKKVEKKNTGKRERERAAQSRSHGPKYMRPCASVFVPTPITALLYTPLRLKVGQTFFYVPPFPLLYTA